MIVVLPTNLSASSDISVIANRFLNRMLVRIFWCLLSIGTDVLSCFFHTKNGIEEQNSSENYTNFRRNKMMVTMRNIFEMVNEIDGCRFFLFYSASISYSLKVGRGTSFLESMI